MSDRWIKLLQEGRRFPRAHRAFKYAMSLLMAAGRAKPTRGLSAAELSAALEAVSRHTGDLNPTDTRILGACVVEDQVIVLTGRKNGRLYGDGTIYTVEPRDGCWEVTKADPWLI